LAVYPIFTDRNENKDAKPVEDVHSGTEECVEGDPRSFHVGEFAWHDHKAETVFVGEQKLHSRRIGSDVTQLQWHHIYSGEIPKLAERTPIHYFKLFFPPVLLELIIKHTNNALKKKKIRNLNGEVELLQYLGLRLILTHEKVGDIDSCWSVKHSEGATPTYRDPPNFGEKFGMSGKRFHEIDANLCWFDEEASHTQVK